MTDGEADAPGGGGDGGAPGAPGGEGRRRRRRRGGAPAGGGVEAPAAGGEAPAAPAAAALTTNAETRARPRSIPANSAATSPSRTARQRRPTRLRERLASSTKVTMSVSHAR